MIQKLTWLAAGAAAWLIPAHPVAAGIEPDKEKPTELTLHGRGWHLHVQGVGAERLPTGGDVLAVHGELLASPQGEAVGTFHGACFCSPAPTVRTMLTATHEFHTFVLPEGSISGMGVAGPDPGAVYSFAIVGGTGRFAGATGHYTARQDPPEIGGDGSAEFHFTFTN